ncbi:MAG: hypothetical protein QG597_2515 [Actinomycetota bacterium]|nr:hypothetical protein [Actinomycetota bacterium]
MATDAAPEGLLVTMPEIAAMAKVKRPVVTTWRRRYPDFPAPAPGTDRSPRFVGRDVVRWLADRSLGNASPKQLHVEIALHALTAQADRFSPRRLVGTISALLCLRLFAKTPLLQGWPSASMPERADADRAWRGLLAQASRLDAEDEYLLRELQAEDATAIPLVALVEELVEAAYSPAAAHEWLLAERARLGPADLVIDAPAPETIRFLTLLADPSSRPGEESLVVADPHLGCGDLLAEVIRSVEDPARIVALGAERQEWMARLARRRLLLLGVNDLGTDVSIGTEIEEGIADPDLVVTHLPYVAGETRDPLATLMLVEQVTDLLGPGRTGVVLGPAEVLVDRLRDREATALRARLLRSGVVEAILSLPGGAVPRRPGYRTAVWTLTRDPHARTRGHVLLADLSAQPLTDQVCARAAEDVVLWRAEGLRPDGHDPRYGDIALTADLVTGPDSALTPSGPSDAQILARPVTDRPALIAEAEGLLERGAAEARKHDDHTGPLHALVVRRTGRRPAWTTIGAMIMDGRIRKVRGHRIDPADLDAVGHHRILEPVVICGQEHVVPRWIDRTVLAVRYDCVRLTEPGDVVYTTVPRLGILVDHDGFSVVAFPAHILRATAEDARPLPPRVLAALIVGARNTARSPAAVRPAKRIEDYVVPDLDADDAARFDALLAEIDRRRALLRAQDDALHDIRQLTVAGLADGTLTIDHP